MPGFSISPASNFPPQTPREFPNSIQFRSGGTDLGGPDADVLAFSTGLTATRGTGDTANVVTVTAAGGAGGAPTLALSLTSSSNGSFDGTGADDWFAVVTQASADATWDDYTGLIHLETEGVYEVVISARLTAVGGTWPTAAGEWSTYGAGVPNAVSNTQSQHFRSTSAAFAGIGQPFVQFTDTFIVDAAALPETIRPTVYARQYALTGSYTASAMVLVRRLTSGLAE